MQGFVSLYDYEKRKCVVRRNTPPLPDFRLLLDDQVKSGTIIYITCPERHEKLITVTALKYSPIGKSFVSYGFSRYIFQNWASSKSRNCAKLEKKNTLWIIYRYALYAYRH